jgi:hypothetical protein
LPEGLTTPLGESSAGSFAFLDVWYEKSENGRSRASYGVGKAKGHPSPLPGFIAEELGDGRASRGKPPIPVPAKNLIQRNWGDPPSVRRLVSGRFGAVPKRRNERLAK